MKFRFVSEECEATRWFKNGDHPLDYTEDRPGIAGGDITIFAAAECREKGWEGAVVRRYRHPSLSGDYLCPFCGNRMHDHGWLDFPPSGQIVCPGDWVITLPSSTRMRQATWKDRHPDLLPGRFRAVSNTAFLALAEDV